VRSLPANLEKLAFIVGGTIGVCKSLVLRDCKLRNCSADEARVEEA